MNDYGTYGIRPRRDPDMRASDAEREAFGERLRREHADGRINTEEFQERIDRCYSAKTAGELEQLVTDLPPERTREPRLPRRRMSAVPLVPIVIAIALIGTLFGAHHHWHTGLWAILPIMLVLRFMLWGRYRRWGMLGGPERQM